MKQIVIPFFLVASTLLGCKEKMQLHTIYAPGMFRDSVTCYDTITANVIYVDQGNLFGEVYVEPIPVLMHAGEYGVRCDYEYPGMFGDVAGSLVIDKKPKIIHREWSNDQTRIGGENVIRLCDECFIIFSNREEANKILKWIEKWQKKLPTVEEEVETVEDDAISI